MDLSRIGRRSFCSWLLLALLCLLAGPSVRPSFAATPDSRCYELRVYYAAPGKLEDLHARFRQHTLDFFRKHGMLSLGYWTPVENPDNKLIYLLSYPNIQARDKSWTAFRRDPEWLAIKADTERNGPLIQHVESTFMQAADFSPEIKPYTGPGRRVFELCAYTATPGNLGRLQARFRDHTLALFSRHGMINLAYWNLLPDEAASDHTLIFLLAHESASAAEASTKAFRTDPEWIKVKEASEREAGGSLTVAPDGITSILLEPTDYSPSW